MSEQPCNVDTLHFIGMFILTFSFITIFETFKSLNVPFLNESVTENLELILKF